MPTEHTCTWRNPPPDLMLSKDEIHLWSLDLDQSVEATKNLAQLLTPDEIQRAERFYFETDRRRFIVGRAWLRILLSNYLHVTPDEVHLRYGKYGKPSVTATPPGDVLYFNLSHAQGLALYVFTLNREVGIDVEYIYPIFEQEQIVASFFSQEEHAVFCTLPVERQHLVFFKSWTQKEAYLKAIGDGLSRPLDEVIVSLSLDEPARILSVKEHFAEHLRWELQTFTPAPDYIATLAVAGHNCKLTCWQGSGYHMLSDDERVNAIIR